MTVGTSQEVVLNRTLAVGVATTQVEVSEATAGVDLAKSSATVRRTLSQQLLQDLPVFATSNQDRAWRCWHSR